MRTLSVLWPAGSWSCRYCPGSWSDDSSRGLGLPCIPEKQRQGQEFNSKKILSVFFINNPVAQLSIWRQHLELIFVLIALAQNRFCKRSPNAVAITEFSIISNKCYET